MPGWRDSYRKPTYLLPLSVLNEALKAIKFATGQVKQTSQHGSNIYDFECKVNNHNYTITILKFPLIIFSRMPLAYKLLIIK
jgi:hypothetical protein